MMIIYGAVFGFLAFMAVMFLQGIESELKQIRLVMRRNEEIAKITREYNRALSARPQPPYGPPIEKP
jgi:hypothetical protein